MRVLKPSDFSPSDFDHNVSILEEVMGSACDQLPRAVFFLSSWSIHAFGGKEVDRMYAPTVPGRYKTAAFLRYLLQLGDRDVLGGALLEARKELMSAFFAPLAGAPEGQHPTREFLLDKCNTITYLADGTGLPERLADKERSKAKRKQDVEALLTLLEHGAERVAEPNKKGEWVVRPHVKDGILQFFSLSGMIHMDAGCGGYDKVPLLWNGWDEKEKKRRGFRVVPPATVRASACIEPGAILMPSYVNVGAFVGSGTMVDTWATVGSCAQIGKRVHLSGGAGIGGVLEPIQASPTIVEDDVFIGARSEVAEGVIVRKGAVLSMGVFIGKNTPIVDRTQSGKITKGEVPAGAVVMMGVHPTNGLICPQIVKYRDEKTSASVALEEALR